GDERGDQLDSGGRDQRLHAAQCAPLARALCPRWLFRPARPAAWAALAAAGAFRRSRAILAVLSRAVRWLQRATLLPDRAPRARRDAVLHLRQDGSAEGRPVVEAPGARPPPAAPRAAAMLGRAGAPRR